MSPTSPSSPSERPDTRAERVVAYRAVLLAAGLIVLGLLFEELLTLLLAVLITVIVAIPLSAFADRMQDRFRVPRPIGALVGLLLGVGVFAVIVILLINPFIDQTNDFIGDVPDTVNHLQDQIEDLTGADSDQIADRVQNFAQGYADDPAKIIGPITSIGVSVAGVLGALVIILITAYYMAINPDPLLRGLRGLVPPSERGRVDTIMHRLRGSWIGWMQGVAVDMVASGVLLYIGLSLIGLDFAIFFAVLAALFTVVPYFGAIASGVPPVLLALTDSPGKALLVLVVYTAVQQFEGNITIPLVMSRTVKLHPAVIAVGVVVVGQLFGFVGLIVAVPILSMLVILTEELWMKPMEAAAERQSDVAHVALPSEPDTG